MIKDKTRYLKKQKKQQVSEQAYKLVSKITKKYLKNKLSKISNNNQFNNEKLREVKTINPNLDNKTISPPFYYYNLVTAIMINKTFTNIRFNRTQIKPSDSPKFSKKKNKNRFFFRSKKKKKKETKREIDARQAQ